MSGELAAKARPETRSPFLDDDAEAEDQVLIQRAVGGDQAALTTLVDRHQRYLYNIALRLVLRPADAEDLTQEALIRIITRLSQFAGKAQFRTWAYRILVNCFRDQKRGKMEQAITTFTRYGEELDELGVEVLPGRFEPERDLLIEEAKVGCLVGMLLCLDREQRLTYVVGEILQAPSSMAAEILDISPAAFRKRLERARRDLTAFMNDKCGLLNEANPCRCARKTKAFIDQGWVDPLHLKFTGRRVSRIRNEAQSRLGTLCSATEAWGVDLHRDLPLVEGPNFAVRIRELLDDTEFRRSLDLPDP